MKIIDYQHSSTGSHEGVLSYAFSRNTISNAYYRLFLVPGRQEKHHNLMQATKILQI